MKFIFSIELDEHDAEDLIREVGPYIPQAFADLLKSSIEWKGKRA